MSYILSHTIDRPFDGSDWILVNWVSSNLAGHGGSLNTYSTLGFRVHFPSNALALCLCPGNLTSRSYSNVMVTRGVFAPAETIVTCNSDCAGNRLHLLQCDDDMMQTEPQHKYLSITQKLCSPEQYTQPLWASLPSVLRKRG